MEEFQDRLLKGSAEIDQYIPAQDQLKAIEGRVTRKVMCRENHSGAQFIIKSDAAHIR